MSDIYSYTVELPKGTIDLADYKDKTLVFVNVASKCGLTPQYKELQALQDTYNKSKNLEIIAFPCNQFGGQEPGTDAEVLEFCQTNYGVTFPIAKKNFNKFLVKDGNIKWFSARTKVSDVEDAL